MGTRSLKAPLSPSEELTLRRIALGVVEIGELPPGPMARLRGLGFLDDANRLTPAGRQRYQALARPSRQEMIDDGDLTVAAMLAQVLRRRAGG